MPRRTQDAGRQQKDRSQEFKYDIDGDTENAKREKEQPHEWIGNKGQESERPAEEKQDQPKEESNHGCVYGRSATQLHEPRPSEGFLVFTMTFGRFAR